ncbi:fibrocystin isoform X7 [Phyllostomus hastatus]|uniref:fibrocystin isoform X7 n=1 Tax=Phyllostomus hastatus TaxID=9423 RepID=UPI001E684C83|nr:fibrocystin isoform X7 [Phyllostomus hastatus]
MIAWLMSLKSIEILLLAVPCLSFHTEPEEGSLAGGTWITIIFNDLESSLLYPANGSQLEIHLVSVAVPALPSIPCDVSPLFLDLPAVMCRTRSLLPETHEGMYRLEVHSGGQVVGSPSPGLSDSCTFKFSRAQTPIVYQVNPPSGVPGQLIHVYGWIITGKLETFDFDTEHIDSPLILEAQGDKWVTPCSLVNRQTGSWYPIQEAHGLGTLQCRVEGNYIGSQNVSFSVFNKGKSMVHKNAWLISAKQDLFLYQTHSEILSVVPETGSLGGRTDITITGDFFDIPVQVTIAGVPCDVRHVSPRKIKCTTRAPREGTRLTAPQAGNRGLLFEVGDAAEGLDLTEATPGYRWQLVPNASSPFGFWSKEGKPFRARLSGFFVAPETNNYTFWIQADAPASLHFSRSEDPRAKVEVASIRVGTTDWFDSWEQNGNEGTWQQKTPKLELLGGTRYYLEAEQCGKAPSRGMRIGVQIHNTWLNPDVVSTYLREKHQIRIRAQRLPEIQMLTVSGTGDFFLTWDDVSSPPISTNATAQQIQIAIEELLAVKCQLEPLSANILLRLGFEQGPEGSSFDGDLTSGTEPFCGRFSLHQPRHLVLRPPAAQKSYWLDQYMHLCIAYKGRMNKTLKVTMSFTTDLQNIIKKNITCDWKLVGTSPESWQFTCTNLWKACLHHSLHLQTSLAHSLVLVHRIDLFPLAQEMGVFYVDEVIIADTNLTVSQADSGTARPGGNLVELLSVVGSPPVFNVTSWLVGCSSELPLITASPVPTDGAEEGSRMVHVTTQRLQRTSPPLGGHFHIQLSNTVIPDVPVRISASHLHKLLQDSADDFTSRYLNVSDFTVMEDLKSCYEHVWTLSWSTQVGDLPNFIKVSDANLTGVNPTATTRVVYDGGVFLAPIFGDMLVTANQHTQVVVRVNDIPAHCSGSCSFQYLGGSTPQVHSVWYSLDGDTALLVYIAGTSFSGDSHALQITVNKTSCKVIFSNQTRVVCQIDLLPVGVYLISMLVRPSGRAINASGEGLFLNVEPRLDAVEPAIAAEIGGLWATIRGSGLEDVSLVLFGSQSCAINVTTSNSRRIQCQVPPRGKGGPIVNVTVISGDHSAALSVAFTYVSFLNPVITSLSRNRSSIAGGETLFIGMARLVDHPDMDVDVLVQDSLAPVHAKTAQGLEVVLPPLPAGLHRVSVSINGISIHSEGVGLHIQYITEVFSIEPCCGSLLGNGSAVLDIEVDGRSYQIGVIGYSNTFTPELLSVSHTGDVLTFVVAQISGVENVDIFIRTSPCAGVSGNSTVLQCVVPPLPAGKYQVRGYDHARGWASSVLVFTSRVTVTAVTENFGCVGGRLLHVFGAGFSPGNISAAVCGAPCQVLANATVSAFSCLVHPLSVSLASLCDLKHEEESCDTSGRTYVQCDLTVTVGTEILPRSWPYLYICEESSQCLFVPGRWTESVFPSLSGLFISPKVERDEVLIYNSSCNITMETEAKMECETPNQPITAKITEIRKSRGQNTQGHVSFHFCQRWSRARSWFPGRAPQDGDNVTVERGQWLLLDTSTSILNFVHVKGGKLVFMDAGTIELRAHSILVSDGGELQIGSEDNPFQGKAEITLYGSSHSTPFFPYGVKFLAVRNGTLSLHGSLPEIIVTHLRAAAHAHDTVLALEDAVDWLSGDEVVIISGMGVKGDKPMEETVLVDTVHNADLHLRSPLRYSYNFTENWVAGQHHILKATVALLSRRITIRGNLTNERIKFLASCQEANASEGDLQHCLYSKSEKMLGSRDLGARVIIQSFPKEPSWVQLKGVQFRDLGQAFHKHLSSLTLVGAMRDSYMQGCTVRSSFSRGLSTSRTAGLKVDSNVFYSILGHALLVGTYMQTRYIPREATPGRKNGGSERGNVVRNNVIIGVSGAEGLSSPEVLTPSGVYVHDPSSVIEGNRVCAAGFGYFFHLVTNQTSQALLFSFTGNIAHSCTRCGLFVYPKFQPTWDNDTGPTLFQNFTVWGSAGGAQIFRSSNLHLKNFQVYSCRDFGIDILESDANTLVTDSLLLGHFAHEGSLCMSVGIKTPKRWELTVSNTTFVNFDLPDCVSIRTCSGCSRGQGGFTVKTNQLKFINSPNLVAFPFAHAAILGDLDGSLSGKNGSHILASMDTLPASCLVNARFSRIVPGSVCGEDVLFHRMSIGLTNAPDVPYDLTMTDSRNKTTTVTYVRDTLSNPNGWMALLLDQETYSLRFQTPWISRSLQYSATFSNLAPGNYLLLVHTILWPHPDILIRCGSRLGRSLLSLPSPSEDQGCEWFFNSQLRQLTYLVSGEGQVQVILQVKEGVPPTIAASTSEPESALKWSLPKAWAGVEEGWGGHDHSTPSSGDDVLILPNRTILVDTDLPSLKGLYVMGTLEFPVDRSNVLSVACIVIAGGELKVGTLENPLREEQKLLILLRASEGVFCNRLNGIHIDPGTIGVYGKVQLHSAYPKKSWTRLGADIASGNERIIVEDTVDWRPQDKIVLSSSSYEPHEAEVLTVKEVKGHHIRIQERLKHRHIGSVHVMEDGRSIRLAAEVGLLTRNIQIQPDTSCMGRLLVGSFRKSSREEFSGILQLLNVEIQNFGSPSFSSIEFTNVSSGSWIISSTLHQSCGGGIHAVASHGITLNDNIVFSTVGHGIDLEGQAYSASNNLVILTTQSVCSTVWVAGIKVNKAKDISLHGNVVAGSERLGFHIQGQRCSSLEALWSDNVVHSSLHGLHLYKESELGNCTSVSGFLAFRNFDYGAMLHVENSVEIENITLVDNTIGLLVTVYVSSVSQHSTENVQIMLRNSVIVATSSSFDCIQDRVKPSSDNLTLADRAPSNPRGGRVGILWPVFTSEPNRWPEEPWHKVRNGHSISGIMKLQDVTFSSFVKSCYNGDLDVCILPNVEDTEIIHPITAERTKMLKIKDKNKFYFSPLQTRKDLGTLGCPESDCESPRKYLFKDLDGRALGLPPPVSVFPKTEAEWTGSFFNTGTFREEQKCTYRSLMQGYICKQTDQVILILDNADAPWTMRKLYPVVSVTSGFVDIFSSVNTNTPCSASGSASTFYSILPTWETTKVCFVDQTPQVLRFFLLGNKSASKLLLAIFYHELQRPHVFLRGSFIPPTQVQSTSSLLDKPIGSNYFSIVDNLLYVVLQGEEPIEIRSGVSIHLAFTVMFSVLEKGWEIMMLERLTDFLQVSQDQIRFIHDMPGNEVTLKAIADRRAKRKRNCPTVTCASHYRVGQRRPLMMEMNSDRLPPPTTMETISKVMVIEIGDLPTASSTGLIPSLSSDTLQNLAHQIITAQQTGVLENVLNMTIGALLVTHSEGVIGYGNTSSFNAGNSIYIRPYALSVLVQPSDGEVGKELPVQPQLVFLDKQNQRVESLGLPHEPWAVSVSLEGTSGSVLKGCTQAETQDGYVSFSDLAVLISGSDWRFIFTVTFPPGTNLTARSRPFAILPVTRSERSMVILSASLCSVVSWLTLCCLVCCWFKKSKSRKIKSENIPESQTNDQKNYIHVSSKHQGSQMETEKEDPTVGEDMKMKIILGKLNQLPHQSVNGVSRRKVSRRAVREEGGSREEAAVSAPSVTGITSHGHTCAAGCPAQQMYMQETGNWKETQEQLLRYQLAGQDQLLLLCPDLRQAKQQLQEQSQLGKDSGSAGLSQGKKVPCGANKAFCLRSVHPEAIHEQL